MVQKFDPASAHTNRSLMSRIVNPPKGKVKAISFLIENVGSAPRRENREAGVGR